jgi:HNH endonuclease
MSYEGKMLQEMKMPVRKKVEEALLFALFKHSGVITEFASGEEIVNEIADDFSLNEEQKTVELERIYRKENRIVKTPLWHRLLYRAADALAKEKFVSRPSQTLKLTNKREWMLTEKGFDKVLGLLNIPTTQKEFLPTKSYEVQKVIKKLNETQRPKDYNPFDKKKKVVKTSGETTLRTRGFRQAVIEAYDCKCAVCGLKLHSPDTLFWEVEAAHIVPHRAKGKDDIWNGLALCHLHHWAFDVGWFTLLDNYKLKLSSKTDFLPDHFGKIGSYELLNATSKDARILLPERKTIYPHQNAMSWHRENIFHQ